MYHCGRPLSAAELPIQDSTALNMHVVVDSVVGEFLTIGSLATVWYMSGHAYVSAILASSQKNPGRPARNLPKASMACSASFRKTSLAVRLWVTARRVVEEAAPGGRKWVCEFLMPRSF